MLQDLLPADTAHADTSAVDRVPADLAPAGPLRSDDVRLEVHPGQEVLVPAGATLGSVRDALAHTLLRPELATCALTVDGAPLGDDHPVGTLPLLPGAVLRAGGPRRSDPHDRATPDAVLRAPFHVAVVAGHGTGRLWPVAAATGRVHDVPVAAGRAGVRSGRRGRTDAAVRVRPPRTARWADRPRRPLWSGRPRRWGPGRVLVVDGSYLELRLGPGIDPGPATSRGSRRPTSGYPGPGHASGPVPPGRPSARTVAAAGVPAAGALVLAAVLRQPLLAAFAVLGPLGMVAGWWATRGSGAAPGVVAPGPRPADVRAWALQRRHGTAGATGVSAGASAGLQAAPAALDPRDGDVPGFPDGCLAVVGRPDDATALARSIVAHHAAAGVRLDLSCAGSGWSWARWLPQAGSGAGVRVVRHDGRTGAGRTPAPRPGEQVLVLAADVDDVPAWCRARAVVRRSRATGDPSVTWSLPGRPTRTGPFTGTDEAWADGLARDLAAAAVLVPGDPAQARSDPRAAPLSLAGVLGLGGRRSDATAIAGRWAAADGGLRAVVGTRVPVAGAPADGPAVLDLVADGPHALVAGTTGSGKSELLQTLLLALATRYPPDDLAMALVDFKGGASFGACADLPHVVGTVTDLDAGLAERALAGLRAELTRRERVLAAAGRTRLDAPVDLPGERLGRLLVVVDEFRALADDLPGLLPGLLRVAAQGRSLGIHLVLATQRPAGAVTGDLRANLALRVALRVTDATDSLDVVGVPDAAGFLGPGVAAVREGSGGLMRVRVAHAGTAPTSRGVRPAPPWPALRRASHVTDDRTRRRAPSTRGIAAGHDALDTTGAASTDVAAALVAACRDAASARAARPQQAPWAPPLPARVTTDELRARAAVTTSVTTSDAGSASVPPGSVPLALADDPECQRHVPVGWDPLAGTLVVVGRRGSGRSTTLRTLAWAWLAAGRTVHVLARDTSGWDEIARHPAAGTVVGADDPVRAARLLGLLDASVPGDDLVLVDDLEAVRSALGTLARGAPGDLLDDLLARRACCAVSTSTTPRGALGTGPRLVLSTGDRHEDALLGVPPAQAGGSRSPGRGVLLVDGSAWTCQVAQQVQAPSPADRAPDAHHVPAADPGTGTGTAADPKTGPGTGPGARPRLRPLPSRVTTDDLRSPGDTTPGRDAPRPQPVPPRIAPLPLGVGGDDARVVHLDPTDGLLVVGPPGSGRSTTLAALATGAARRGTLTCVVSTDASVLDVGLAAGVRTVDLRTHGATEARAAVDAALAGPGLVVVDGLDDLLASPALRLGEPWDPTAPAVGPWSAAVPPAPDAPPGSAAVPPAPDAPPGSPTSPRWSGGPAGSPDVAETPTARETPAAPVTPTPPGPPRGVLAASVTTTTALAAVRGPVAALRRARCGVLLGAGEPGAGEVFGLDVSWLAPPRGQAPGRAVVVGRVAERPADGTTRLVVAGAHQRTAGLEAAPVSALTCQIALPTTPAGPTPARLDPAGPADPTRERACRHPSRSPDRPSRPSLP